MMAKYLVQASAVLIGLSVSTSAYAQMDAIIPTDDWDMRPVDEEAIYRVKGFPVNYDFSGLSCRSSSFNSDATFKKIFFAKNMPPRIREEVKKVITEVGGMQITTREKEADLLVEGDALVPGSIADTTVINLWAVKKRATKTKRGTRCTVFEGVKPDLPRTVGYFKSFLEKMARLEGGPLHFANRDSYAINGSCYKLIPDAEILSFKNIFIADSPSPEVTQAMKKQILATSKFAIVGKAVNANYIVSIVRDFNTTTTRTVDRGRGGGTSTVVDGGSSNPVLITRSSPRDPDTITTTRSENESGELLVLAVKHPKNGEKKGLVCSAYKQEASKGAGFNIWNQQGTSGTLVDGLGKYLKNPDLTYKSINY
jgi:hypothetical protein